MAASKTTTSSKTTTTSSKTTTSSSTSSSTSSKSNPETPKLPDKIDPNDYKDKVEHSGTIIIDGKKEPGFIVDGGAYDKDGNLLNNKWGNGVLDVAGGDYTAEYIPNGNNTGGTAIFNSNKKEEEKTPSKPSSGGSVSYSPPSYTPPSPPPPPPPKIEWTEPFPTFSSNLKIIHKFTYFFGLDKLYMKDVSLNDTCCFISEYINVGSLKLGEYIELDATCDISDNASIEFYILDGEMEVPIVPINDKLIQNEKIFHGMPTRFEIDETSAYTIFYNQSPSEVDLATAIQKESGYTITYKPKGGYTYRPLNQDIKIKAILRSYSDTKYAPRITSMKIRKYGGDALWS